jgi:two-component system chemotaxis sensor kinase CheA
VSERVDLKEFLPAYLAEVDEQLRTANARLLDIEASTRKGESNPRAVRDLFRAVHTVKGLSAMVGVEPAVAVAHRMEAALRTLVDAGEPVALPSVDALLSAVRCIDHQVRDLSQGKAPPAAPPPILAALAQLGTTERAARSAAPQLELDSTLAGKLAPFELDLLAAGPATGRRSVRIDFSPSPAKAARGLSVNTVRERVRALGEIIKVVPLSVVPSEDAPGALSFALLVLTSASDEELGAAVGVPPETVVDLMPATKRGSMAPTPTRDDEPDDSLAPSQRRNVVRVEVSRLDDAMEHLSELIVTRRLG